MKQKNALRQHYIAPFDPKNPNQVPEESAWLRLAKNIKTVEDETDEETDDTGYYDGDGTPEETVTSVAAGYSYEGIYDAEDPAQKLIADMRYKIGDGRRVWQKVVSSDGKAQWVAPANVSGIKAGSGDAVEYETFECKIKWIKLPTETKITAG